MNLSDIEFGTPRQTFAEWMEEFARSCDEAVSLNPLTRLRLRERSEVYRELARDTKQWVVLP